MNQVKDWASINDVASQIPVRMPHQEMSGEEQASRYSQWMQEEKPEFFHHIWVPLPTQNTDKPWDLEKIKVHVKMGYPVYIRLFHSEDGTNNQAILPSRINQDKDGQYDPTAFHELFAKYAYVLIPQEIRFAKGTPREIDSIQEKESLSRYKAICKFAAKHTGEETSHIKRIFECFLDLHQSSSTHLTPFKGMLGGTINDPLFVEEMENVLSSYQSSRKVSIIVDKYGRFLHNYLNDSGQSREFLALGGILASELVGQLEFSEFKSLFKA